MGERLSHFIHPPVYYKFTEETRIKYDIEKKKKKMKVEFEPTSTEVSIEKFYCYLKYILWFKT